MSGTATKRVYGAREAAARNDLLNPPTPTSMVLFAKKFPYYLMTEDMVLFMKTKEPAVCMSIIDELKSMPIGERAGHMKSNELKDAISAYVVSMTNSPKAAKSAIDILRVDLDGNISE
ncbi:MAG TPA: hypothetical protein VMV00_01615 [Candidatus Baltobacteraceae bacterium]|nr:hypothetical protein [Candidatus Baltobacteraceae bacterium]